MTETIDSQDCTSDAFAAYRTILAKTKTLSCRILSDSMWPLLRVGQSVTISPVPDELRPFDLIVFRYGERLYCHFVWAVWKDPHEIQTRSLKTCLSNDLPIDPSHVLGKVVDRKVPWWMRAAVILLNTIRRTS